VQSGLSTHFWVAQDGTIEQYVPLSAAAYGQGIVTAGSDFPAGYPGDGPNYNRMAVSIEREGKAYQDGDADEPSDAQWASIVALNRWLAFTHGLPLDSDHIVGHYRSDHLGRARCPSSRSMDAPTYMSRLLQSLKAESVAAQSDAWSQWSAETIAAATGCPVEAVRTNWPLLYSALEARAIADAPVCAAVIGTVAVETASTFAPVREAFWLSEAWRMANLRYAPFYGRGYIQLTWEFNYRAYGDAIGVDLVDNPDLALEPQTAAAVMAEYFLKRDIATVARQGNWTEVRRRVQGGTAGLDRLVAVVGALGL
jgi:hypothetical protein